MQVSYGPAGLKGVTQLMAVGDGEFDETTTDRAVKIGAVASAVVVAFGLLTGQQIVRDVGLGGLLALAGVRLATRGPRVVAITQPAMAGWRRI